MLVLVVVLLLVSSSVMLSTSYCVVVISTILPPVLVLVPRIALPSSDVFRLMLHGVSRVFLGRLPCWD